MRTKPEPDALDGSGARWTYTRRGYALSQSLRQLKQQRIASLGTLLMLGITLALPVILYFAYLNLATLGHRSLEGESITTYLRTNVSDIAGAELAESWSTREDVARTDYLSKEQSLAMLGEASDISSVIALLGVNPLPGAIVVYPQITDVATGSTDRLAEVLRSIPEVERVQLDLRWVRRLAAAISLLAWIGGLLAVFLTLSALLVITNTIRLELARRKSELEVANLLGAPRHFMNRPIIYTGAVYGLLGGLLASITGLMVLNAVQSPADTLSSLYQNEFTVSMPTMTQILLVISVCVCLGLIGAVSSLYRPSQHFRQ